MGVYCWAYIVIVPVQPLPLAPAEALADALPLVDALLDGLAWLPVLPHAANPSALALATALLSKNLRRDSLRRFCSSSMIFPLLVAVYLWSVITIALFILLLQCLRGIWWYSLRS